MKLLVIALGAVLQISDQVPLVPWSFKLWRCHDRVNPCHCEVWCEMFYRMVIPGHSINNIAQGFFTARWHFRISPFMKRHASSKVFGILPGPILVLASSQSVMCKQNLKVTNRFIMAPPLSLGNLARKSARGTDCVSLRQMFVSSPEIFYKYSSLFRTGTG